MPLILAPENVELTIIKVLLDDKLKKHLQDMGIAINGKITILSKGNGSVICIVKYLLSRKGRTNNVKKIERLQHWRDWSNYYC